MKDVYIELAYNRAPNETATDVIISVHKTYTGLVQAAEEGGYKVRHRAEGVWLVGIESDEEFVPVSVVLRDKVLP